MTHTHSGLGRARPSNRFATPPPQRRGGPPVSARWSYRKWRAELRLPFGVSWLATTDASIGAGDVVARGTRYRATRRVDAAKVLACSPESVRGLLRVTIGERVPAGAIVARQGRRFARAIVAEEEGRLVHVDAAGGVYLGTVRAEWEVRSPLDGVVRRADAHAVVEGSSWALSGLAAYGPSRAGILASGVRAPQDELAPARLDVSYRDRVLMAGARVAGEALTRAHAVGAAGLVAAATSFRVLLAVYGDDVSAFGWPTDEDVPTLLVLGAFGRAPFDRALFDALRALEGTRASIDTTSARLHVFAPPGASRPLGAAPLELADDLSGARPR